MSNLFIKPEDEINIIFAIATDDKGKIYSSSNIEALKDMLKDIKCEIKEYSVVFKKPSFKDIVELGASSVSAKAGGLSFNPSADRYYRMIKLIKSWTLTDEKGNIIEPTETTIGQLAPGIADTISNVLDVEINCAY